MGQLKPGATYVYERANEVIYAREIGAKPNERFEIGRDHTLSVNAHRMKLSDTWMPILEAAEHNPALQDALDRVKLVYELSKQQDPLFHHPV